MSPQRATSAGLLLLGLWLLVSPPAGNAAGAGIRLMIGALCALPLVILAVAGLRGVRQWGTWVAIVLIPYFALSVGAMLVNPGGRTEGTAFSVLVAVVFFLGIAADRQRG
jgi:uncharacterized membrane protein